MYLENLGSQISVLGSQKSKSLQCLSIECLLIVDQNRFHLSIWSLSWTISYSLPALNFVCNRSCRILICDQQLRLKPFLFESLVILTLDLIAMSAPVPTPFQFYPFISPGYPMVAFPAPRRKYRQIRGQGREALVVAQTLGDFDFQECLAWKEISKAFGDRLKITHVRSLAIAVHLLFPDHVPKLTRTESRRFSLIIKWFNEHWTFIGQVIRYFSLTDDAFHKITLV
jgi:hypothetical protein